MRIASAEGQRSSLGRCVAGAHPAPPWPTPPCTRRPRARQPVPQPMGPLPPAFSRAALSTAQLFLPVLRYWEWPSHA
eukprot:15092286-Alexandrium_andersonii.AAC.1